MRDGVNHRIDQLATLGQERLARQPPLHGVAQFVFFQQRDDAAFNHLVGQFRTKTEVELHGEITGDHIIAARTRLKIRNLHAGRREEFVAFIPFDINQLIQHGRSAMHRVIG
ncbi:hypothetical protein D3C78_670310 [compost metagenome]